MAARRLRVGTRTSPLALKQAEEALVFLRPFYPGIQIEIIGIDTYGDKAQLTPISEIEGTDFFTREIDQALLKHEIDFSVHSAKDLPDRVPEGLSVAVITESIDPFDVLVSKENLSLSQLPYRARIGTSSSRRKAQLKSYRSDFEIVDIRGNIEERLRLLDSNHLNYVGNRHACSLHLDAIVIAACALIRLGLEERITQRIPFEILKPHPLQGCLAIEIRKDDRDTIKILSVYSHTVGQVYLSSVALAKEETCPTVLNKG